MSYIIVHIYDPQDIETMDVLPDEKGESIQIFENKVEAIQFLNQIGMDRNSWIDSDVHVVRLQ
jgi:hypothetical protein|tara:strand:- start:429 stop:617 length:189 start_codon:yes stop_codon:yes gene_type:complete